MSEDMKVNEEPKLEEVLQALVGTMYQLGLLAARVNNIEQYLNQVGEEGDAAEPERPANV